MTERDKILKALRDVPGVFELNSDPSVTVFQRKWVAGGVGVGYYTESGSLVIQSCETKRNATLAEAVAALTPPAEPKPPTYEFVAGIKGAKKRAEYIFFERQNGTRVEFNFGADGDMLSAYLEGQDLATPTTEPEVLTTLRMCRVEVK